MHNYSKAPPEVLEDVVCEHIANVSQVFGGIRNAPFSPQSGESFDSLCCRCEDNLDALRIAGDKAISFGQTAIQDDCEAASVVALLLAESDNGQPGASEQSVALLRHEPPEIRQAAWWGLRLANSRHVEPHLRGLLRKSSWDFASAAALDVLAFHRLPVQVDLGRPPDDEGDEIAWLLAEAGGRMRGAWNARHLKQYVGHASPRVREAALRASARCGLAELPAFCREATARLDPLEAIAFLGVVGSPQDASMLQRATSNPAVSKAAVGGLGRLGLPTSVPFLLDLMESPELAEAAAAAFWRIIGEKAPRGPAPDPPPGLTEDELDLWEPRPPVDLPRARDWWKSNAARFDPAKHYQVGLNVSDDPLGSVFDQLPLAIRYDVYLRERALTPGTPDWELETWTWKQKTPGA